MDFFDWTFILWMLGLIGWFIFLVKRNRKLGLSTDIADVDKMDMRKSYHNEAAGNPGSITYDIMQNDERGWDDSKW